MTMRKHLPVLGDPDARLGETLRVLHERRRVLALFASAGTLALLSRGARACSLIPEETAGPYPADGTNGPNVLTESGIVRADIRSSFGDAGNATAPGTPLTVTLQLVSTTSGCGPIEGLAVYVWHCDASGDYSLYSPTTSDQNYLRGVLVTDANGQVSFTTVYPGCYSGRWPHIHFEVFASLEDATSGRNAGNTSQIAMPQDACDDVYAQSVLYPDSANNLAHISLASDNVFGNDGGVRQIATVSGNNTDGYTAVLEVGVAVDATTSDIIFTGSFDG